MISIKLCNLIKIFLPSFIIAMLVVAIIGITVHAEDPVQVTVSGTWKYFDRDLNSINASIFHVRLYNYTTQENLGYNYTDENGYFSFSPVDNPGSDGLEVRIYPRVQYGISYDTLMVMPPGGTEWSDGDSFYGTTYKITLNGTETSKPLGNKYVGLFIDDAFWIRDDIQSGYDFAEVQLGSFLTQWDKSGNQTWPYSFFSTDASNKIIHIKQHDAENTPDTVLHEMGHNVMGNVYGYANYPPGSTSSGHLINQEVPSTEMAWKEGWAHAWLMFVTNDPVKNYPSGGSVDLENQTWGAAGWDDGDKVEGRIAGALWDIVDNTDDYYKYYADANNVTQYFWYDQCAEGFDEIWETFLNSPYETTFRQFWDSLKSNLSHPESAARALHQNTIDYNDGYLKFYLYTQTSPASSGVINISPDSDNYTFNETVNLTYTENGWTFIHWERFNPDGFPTQWEQDSTAWILQKSMTHDRAVQAKFEPVQEPHYIHASSTPGGTIYPPVNPPGYLEVQYGDGVSFTFSPLDGYHMSGLIVDNTGLTPEETADRVLQLYDHSD